MKTKRINTLFSFLEVIDILELYEHQKDALKKLKNGSVLVGDVGSGKSLTGLAYYFTQCGGQIEPCYSAMTKQVPLYIITTAKKRDSHEWDGDMSYFLLSSETVVVDSWNNIKKYIGVKDAFFIFDEQRLVGYGAWVKSFLKIVKANQWILLTATPGDSWQEFIPLFIAHGYYRNKTEFENLHCEFNPYTKWKQIKKYHNVARLMRQKKDIIVEMPFNKGTKQQHNYIKLPYDKQLYLKTMKTRWDPYKDEPFQNISAMCYTLRKIVNGDRMRTEQLWSLYFINHPRIVVFYNFDYELESIRAMCEENGVPYAEWNGHKHQSIPDTDEWLYLVQYSAGAEGWNCTSCCAMVFYSASYSYKAMIQAAGRIDRLNNKYKTLYYYHFTSDSPIDRGIEMALKKKQNFNEKKFLS